MAKIRWQRSALAGIFEQKGVSVLVEEPILVIDEFRTEAEAAAATVEIKCEFTFEGMGRDRISVVRSGEQNCGIDICFFELRQRNDFQLIGEIVPFPAARRSVVYTLPPRARKGKLLVIDSNTGLSIAALTIVEDARTSSVSGERFRIARKSFSAERLRKDGGESVGSEKRSEVLELSEDDERKLAEIFEYGTRVAVAKEQKKPTGGFKEQLGLGWVRAIMLNAVSACPTDVQGHMREFDDAPCLEALLQTYWPLFMRFRSEMENLNLRDAETMWAFHRLVRAPNAEPPRQHHR